MPKKGAVGSASDFTKKVGYDPEADLKRGVCGYEGCKLKLRVVAAGAPKPLNCESHEETRAKCFSYLDEKTCHTDFNTKFEFSTTFAKSHQCIHHDADKTNKEGHLGEGREHYQDVGRTYGAYNLSEPLAWLSNGHKSFILIRLPASAFSWYDSTIKKNDDAFAPTLPTKVFPAHGV